MWKRAFLIVRDFVSAWNSVHMHTHTCTGEVAQVKTEATGAAKTMNLSVIRLCFQAFLMDEHGRFTIPVDPVFSHKVYDSSKSILDTALMHTPPGIKCTYIHNCISHLALSPELIFL